MNTKDAILTLIHHNMRPGFQILDHWDDREYVAIKRGVRMVYFYGQAEKGIQLNCWPGDSRKRDFSLSDPDILETTREYLEVNLPYC